MKTPLRYQVTAYDCGPISLMNAFSYLYDDREIPAVIIQAIWRYSLDRFGDNGNLGEGGTSKYAMQLFVSWLKAYAKTNSFPIKVSYLRGRKITSKKLSKFLNKHGVVVARCYQSQEHYILITGVSNKYFYIFDPYYVDEGFINNDKMIKFDWKHPFQYNRIVTKKRLFSETEKDFSLGFAENRECIFFSIDFF